MRLITQARRREYLFRHLGNFLPHLTFFKVYNLALNVIEKRHKIASPRSLPPYVKIEPTPLCQLRCPGCKQSIAGYKKQFRNSMQLSLDDFKRIVDPLSRGLLGISLSNHGEPLLHDNISSLIAYAHKKNIAVSFPTNLSLKLDASSIEALVKSGLDSISVSLDGASEETYSQYRVGGNFSLVLDNVRLISAARQRLGLKRPRIIWKFVVFDHNKHELDTVMERHKDFGFDAYEFVSDNQSTAAMGEDQTYKASLRASNKACFWLWHAMVIRWDGEVFPCCADQYFNLGNAISDNVRDIWRSDAYKALRQGFSSRGKMNPICRKCMGYRLIDDTVANNKG